MTADYIYADDLIERFQNVELADNPWPPVEANTTAPNEAERARRAPTTAGEVYILNSDNWRLPEDRVVVESTPLADDRGYRSFSGIDIRAVIEGESVGTLQEINYNVRQERAPTYRMSSVDPSPIPRRGIAGTMTNITVDEGLLQHDGTPSHNPTGIYEVL